MSSEEAASNQQPSRRLKLVLKTSPLSTPVVQPQPNDRFVTPKDGSSSPPRPSYSPVTPTLSHEKLAAPEKAEAQFIDEPSPLPLNLEDNADAIALKATISLLQMQRQQSLKDIRDLDKIKDAAVENPRKLKKPQASEIVFDDVEYEDSDEDEQADNKTDTTSKFGRLPNPQNVARCPPIEWSKYHILGKPLDDLHEAQKKYPGATGNEIVNKSAREHEITAPYRPFKDKLDTKKGTEGYST
ncbi:hypothetical protein LTS08_004378 [Lithohypha guttulata]|uniref:Uncharacterized protein n=1 Tax=Lithohypha guttulata TaxID=1690604 RepID=A0AAN7T123_9EURO|nr:hypothetical protein LTR51_007659 [Lithohypha guttulata]KAK5086312.1 hypothetical protein LTR05_003480 [Lithohypha guttulata]KAK5101919.1 hypothetical protein LTS08_004378 [Lithohypha guttulata]